MILLWLMGLLALILVTSYALIDARRQKRSGAYTIVAVEREKK